MTDVAKLQLIEAYHHGILSESEQKEFDQLMLTDDAFAAEVEDYEFLLDGFDMLSLESFESNIQTWEQKYQTAGTEAKVVTIGEGSARKRKFNMQRFIAVAAAIVGIAFMPLAYNMLFNSTDVYNEMFKTPMAMIVRGGGDAESPDKDAKEKALDFALNFYNKQDYQRASELLNTYVTEYGDKEYEAIFFLGICQMVTEKYKAASFNFEHILENSTGYNAQQAEWMLVLTQYKLDNKENAIRYAEKIVSNKSHNFQKQAKEFLSKVN